MTATDGNKNGISSNIPYKNKRTSTRVYSYERIRCLWGVRGGVFSFFFIRPYYYCLPSRPGPDGGRINPYPRVSENVDVSFPLIKQYFRPSHCIIHHNVHRKGQRLRQGARSILVFSLCTSSKTLSKKKKKW